LRSSTREAERQATRAACAERSEAPAEWGSTREAERGGTMRLWAWGQSDPGKKRERNEDSYLADPSLGVMAVADGMGGHQGGATASRMAVELLALELAEARGDFDAAVRAQHELSVRTTV